MSKFDYWLDRTAIAVAAPPVDPTPPERTSTTFDSVSRSDLLRDAAQRLPVPPHSAIRAEPLQQSLHEIPRSTALKTIAAAVALLCGIRLTGPPAASAATVAECKSACNGMFAKANAERVARCEAGPNYGKKVFDSIFQPKSAAFERGVLDAVCYSWGGTATALEWNECRDQCDLTQKAKPPAPTCPPAAQGARAEARVGARTCADLAPPPPPPVPPGSDCTPNSCEMVGGVCCGPYTSPEGNGGCVVNCSACINPAVSSC
jgi:hypothetical protein